MNEDTNQEVSQSQQQALEQSASQDVPAPPKESSKIGYIFGGISFIPLIGVLFGVLAIVIGILQKKKGPVILGVCGILLTILLYGSLFYFGFIAKTGPWAELKPPLAQQVLDQNKGQILIYKENTDMYPETLKDMPDNYLIYPADPWMNDIIYTLNEDGTFDLRSSGPDGIPYNEDDVLPSN